MFQPQLPPLYGLHTPALKWEKNSVVGDLSALVHCETWGELLNLPEFAFLNLPYSSVLRIILN